MERAVCQRFREHAPIYLSDVEKTYLDKPWEQLVVMQHYGAPTRLLDWTKSPWVAAFFAVFGNWGENGYIYGFKRNKLEQAIKHEYPSELNQLDWGARIDNQKSLMVSLQQSVTNNVLFNESAINNFSSWIATYYSREGHFPRLVAQQGLFTFGSVPNIDHWEFITSLLSKDDVWFFEIEKEQKRSILSRLNSIGLNGVTLMPGLDGIGKTMEGFLMGWLADGRRPSQFDG